MENSILNEINNIKFLFNYDRSKTLNEQPEPAGTTGSTQTMGTSGTSGVSTPIPTPTVPKDFAGTSGTSGASTQLPTPDISQASSITPDNPQAFTSKTAMGAENDPYQYKFEDDGNVQKYYYAKKGQNDWKQSTNPKSVEAIKRNVFKIR